MQDNLIQRKSLDLMEFSKYKELLKSEMQKEAHKIRQRKKIDADGITSVDTMVKFIENYREN
jgi:single-stranded DNA-specific DHH superfamily exonuclease